MEKFINSIEKSDAKIFITVDSLLSVTDEVLKTIFKEKIQAYGDDKSKEILEKRLKKLGII